MSVLHVGVDLGATRVRAALVEVIAGSEDGGYRVSRHVEARLAKGRTPFRPVALERQLEEAQAAHGPQPAADEERAAGQGVTCIARVIADLLRALPGSPGSGGLQIGMAAPGRKTSDGGGILVARNGPRHVGLTRALERALERAGFELAAPIGALVSDGMAAGVGESAGDQGVLRGVGEALVFVPGTGLAEARRAAGAWIEPGFEPLWSLRDADGVCLEDRVSAASIARAWDGPAEEAELAAATGDPAATAVFAAAAEALGDVVRGRLEALARSAEGAPTHVVLGGHGARFLQLESYRSALGHFAGAELVGACQPGAAALGAFVLSTQARGA